MPDQSHVAIPFRLNELDHHYGEHVHLIADPYANTLLAKLCAEGTIQPEINRLVRRLYERLVIALINHRFPRHDAETRTRMIAHTDRAILLADSVIPSTPVVTVDVARAGIIPSMTCYELLNELLDPRNVRQDHLMVSRVVDDHDHVKGAQIAGGKIGGPVTDSLLLFPDPMGATGASLSAAINHYKREHGTPQAIATLNLIITPEFIRRLRTDHPDVELYALRLDRGMSAPEILDTIPGERWDEERGLNDHDYIVPGGGGFGEIMNNAWV